MRVTAAWLVAAATLGAADRMFTNVELQLPASMSERSGATPAPATVSSDELSVFLAYMSGQALRVDDVDNASGLLDVFFEQGALPALPKLLVVTTVSEQDRAELPPPQGSGVWRAAGAGSLDDILKAVHHMGTDVTPKLVDNELVKAAIKTEQAKRIVEQAENPGLVWAPPKSADKCTAMLAEEKNAVAQITGELGRWLATDQLAGLPLVISLNPSRVTDCLRREDGDESALRATAGELLRLVDSLEAAATDAAAGDALVAVVFYESRAALKEQQQAEELRAEEQRAAEQRAEIQRAEQEQEQQQQNAAAAAGPPAAQPAAPPMFWFGAPAALVPGGNRLPSLELSSLESSSLELSSLESSSFDKGVEDVVQISARRRRLQGETPVSMPIPYSITLWLCVALAAFVVAGVLPLWWLSDLEDPVIDTKLFASAVH